MTYWITRDWRDRPNVVEITDISFESGTEAERYRDELETWRHAKAVETNDAPLTHDADYINQHNAFVSVRFAICNENGIMDYQRAGYKIIDKRRR